MKIFKTILIILNILLLCYLGYSFLHKKEEPKEYVPIKEVEEKEEIKEEIKEPEDTNKIIIGLYKNYRNGENRKLITEYSKKWTYHEDISSFEVYYTNEEEITNDNQIKTFDLYKNNYENIDDYRIGYKVEFTTNNDTISKVIISPKDTEDFYQFIEAYLYDDYHRTGGWYSHTTEQEWNDNTLLTSIKLTAGKNVGEITSDITLTTFLYKLEELNRENIGNNTYSITIKNN